LFAITGSDPAAHPGCATVHAMLAALQLSAITQRPATQATPGDVIRCAAHCEAKHSMLQVATVAFFGTAWHAQQSS